MKQGMNMSEIDKVSEEIKHQASQEFDRFIRDKNTKYDSKNLIIEAYEGMLYDKRKSELEVLNLKRFREYEKNRPP